jgi:hypothetical protein
MAEDLTISVVAETAAAEGNIQSLKGGIQALPAAAKKAAGGMNAMAGAVDVLKVSMSALQKTFLILNIINTLINWFGRLAEATKAATEWFQKLAGIETAGERIDKIAASVDKLTESYQALVDKASEYQKLIKDDTAASSREVQAAIAQKIAVVDLRLQQQLAETSDPGQRDRLERQAEGEKAAIGTGAVETKQIEIRGVDAAMAALGAERKDLLGQIAAAATANNAAVGMQQGGRVDEKKAKELADAQDKAAKAYDAMVARLAAIDKQASALSREKGTLAVELGTAETERAAALQADRNKTSNLEKELAAADLYTEAAASPEAAEAARARTEAALAAARAALADAEAAERARTESALAAPAAAPDAAELRQQIDTLLQDLEIVTRASKDAQGRKKDVDSELDDFFGPVDAAAEKQAEVRAETQKKIDAITVAAPRAATASGAAGLIMGRQIDNAARLQEQREARRDAILKEEVVLLAQIKEALDE